jgi:hypothetical protein
MSDERTEYIRCPSCGWVGELDECEVSGAEEGHVFCGTPQSLYIPVWLGAETEEPDSPRTEGPGCTAEIPIEENLFVPGPTPRETQRSLFA